MESTSDLRQTLEAAIASIRRRIDASEMRVGTGFPVQAMWRDNNLGELRRTLTELEETLSSLEADSA